MGFSVGGFLRGAAGRLSAAKRKISSLIAPRPSPETWTRGQPAPAGYRVVSAGSRSEKIEPIPLSEAGGLRAVIDREITGPGADTLRKIGGDLAENIRHVAERVGDAASSGLAKPLLESETVAKQKRILFAAFGALALISLITLAITLSRKKGV